MSTILQSVKKKIYAVCPDALCKAYEPKMGMLCQCSSCAKLEYPGLPEVLRAIGKKIDFQIFQFDIQNNEMYLWDTGKDEETGFRWNLLVNLDGQSEEVWKFLDEIL